jgi:hypothetical protein
MIETGQLAYVEVKGLPGHGKSNFTYRTTYPVAIGETVKVPVPEWAERIIGSDPLSGVVLSQSDNGAAYVYDIRDILPEQDYVLAEEPHGMIVIVDTDAVAEVLANVRQKMYSEMIYGNGRQPAEVVEYVGMELADLFASHDEGFDETEFSAKSEPELRDE